MWHNQIVLVALWQDDETAPRTEGNSAARGWALAPRAPCTASSLSQGCRCWPSVAPGTDWRQLLLTVPLCPCLFTLRAWCHAPEPRSSTRPFAHSAHLGLSSGFESSVFRQSWIAACIYPYTFFDSCYKAKVIMLCCGRCCDLPPKWESITCSLLSVFEIKTVTSFCK